MNICYIVLTCEKFWETRIIWQKQTVFKKVSQEDIFYLGHIQDLPKRLFWWGAKDDYLSLPYKLLHFFQNICLEKKYDWYMILDDDTFVFINRLEKRLKSIFNKKYWVEGHILDHLSNTEWGRYHSGGAGTVLSHIVFEKLCHYLKKMPKDYSPPHWCADISLGIWLKSLLPKNFEFIHNPNFHPEIFSKENIEELQNAITYHHLKTWDDYCFLCQEEK